MYVYMYRIVCLGCSDIYIYAPGIPGGRPGSKCASDVSSKTSLQTWFKQDEAHEPNHHGDNTSSTVHHTRAHGYSQSMIGRPSHHHHTHHHNIPQHRHTQHTHHGIIYITPPPTTTSTTAYVHGSQPHSQSTSALCWKHQLVSCLVICADVFTDVMV